jgi:hypothetical protein
MQATSIAAVIGVTAMRLRGLPFKIMGLNYNPPEIPTYLLWAKAAA